MPAKNKRTLRKVVTCACRVDNYGWIRERRLYGIYSGVPDVRVTANRTTNGGISVTSASVVFHQGAEDDGKWHHWAMTTEADATGSNTVFTLYKDYVQHGNVVTVAGLLRFPSNGVNLSIGGTGVHGAYIHGLVNNLRISPGVLPTSAFMRYIPKAGTWIIVL